MATKKKVASKVVTPKVSTDAQIIAKATTDAPWLIPLFTDPVHGKTYLQWARDAEPGGKGAPTDLQIQAQTYNWDMNQVWSSNQSAMFNLSISHPGEYKTQRDATVAVVDGYIAKKGNPVGDKTRQELIDDIFIKGWKSTDPRIEQLIGGTFDSTKATTGSALSTKDSLNSLAQNYMLPMSTETLDSWGKSISSGTSTLADFENTLKTQAGGLYPFMKGTINSITPADYFSPLKSMIQKNLEINPSQIDFNDPSGKWMNLVTSKDPKTGENVARNLSDSIKEMRTNPIYGYDYTQGAKDSAYELGSNIRSMMGFGA